MKRSIYISSLHFFISFFVDLSISISPFEGREYVKFVIIKARHYPVCESFSPKNELETGFHLFRVTVLIQWSLEPRQNTFLKSQLNF